MIRADLHVHTKYSNDSSINPKTLVDQLHAHPSIKAVAITDHNTTEGYSKVKQLADTYTDIFIIPGVEITTPIGDIILLGTTEMPRTTWNIKEIMEHANKKGYAAIVPHPYREYGLGSNAKNYAFDAVETLNGCTSQHINRLAENLAKEMSLPCVAGSDAHNISELWTVYTEIQAQPNIEEILQAVKRGAVKPFTTRKSIHF